MGRWVALTGTPGTGKSSVAARLPRSWRPVEVGVLALELGAGKMLSRGRTRVDLPKLRERFRSPDAPVRVLVGHLAHLLPIRDVVILRCRPPELARRLARARRGSASERLENTVSEAIDLILVEARNRRRRIWEMDTSGRTVGAVAAEVAKTVRARPPPRSGTVDWLSDPSTTAYLLHRAP